MTGPFFLFTDEATNKRVGVNLSMVGNMILGKHDIELNLNIGTDGCCWYRVTKPDEVLAFMDLLAMLHNKWHQ